MSKYELLFIDDDPDALNAYKRSLRKESSEWVLTFESCPMKAWQRMQETPFDVVITDIRMPGMSGLELMELARQHPTTESLPIIAVTGNGDRDLKRQALDLDAADLLEKPIYLEELVARLRNALRSRQQSVGLQVRAENLEKEVQQRTSELEASRLDILMRLGKAAEYRDQVTGNHVIRVGDYSRIVAQALGMSESFCNTLQLAAPLHDIGKIGVSDSILRKPGQLSEEEWSSMREHCAMGHSILLDGHHCDRVASDLLGWKPADLPTTGYSNPVIEMAASIAYSHHERWDGTGYPLQKKGEEIPIEGRIVAVADVYDALRSERPYKQACTPEEAQEILLQGSGNHFDPRVVEAFFSAYDQIQVVESEYGDHAIETV